MLGLRECDRPGKQEGDFQVENDEQDRDEIEADVEPAARIVEGVEAALVGRELLRIGILFRQNPRSGDHRDRQPQGNSQKDGDRQIFG